MKYSVSHSSWVRQVPAAAAAAAADASSFTARSEFSAAAAAAASDGRLTWPALRAAGCGLWLTDAKVLRSTAEALAKAQFAERRDAHDCALMYLALGRRSLLQVYPPPPVQHVCPHFHHFPRSLYLFGHVQAFAVPTGGLISTPRTPCPTPAALSSCILYPVV